MSLDRTDEELMLLFQKGSRDAFEEIFARYHRKVANFAFRMIGDPARAEEAAQEIFLRIARGASAWQPRARFKTWMYTIARRTALNYIRDESEPPDSVPIAGGGDDEDASPGVQVAGPDELNPEQAAWSAQLAERFAAALGALPESYRSAFVLNRGEGLSYEEVASVLGISVQAVKSRIFRAREMLLSRLSDVLP